jgi:hypothetical protein
MKLFTGIMKILRIGPTPRPIPCYLLLWRLIWSLYELKGCQAPTKRQAQITFRPQNRYTCLPMGPAAGRNGKEPHDCPRVSHKRSTKLHETNWVLLQKIHITKGLITVMELGPLSKTECIENRWREKKSIFVVILSLTTNFFNSISYVGTLQYYVTSIIYTSPACFATCFMPWRVFRTRAEASTVLHRSSFISEFSSYTTCFVHPEKDKSKISEVCWMEKPGQQSSTTNPTVFISAIQLFCYLTEMSWRFIALKPQD